MIINMNGAKAPETPSSVLQEKTVTPETLPVVIGADEGYDGLSQVTVNPDAQLKAENIRSGKTVFGVEGSFVGEPSLGVDFNQITGKSVGVDIGFPLFISNAFNVVTNPPMIDKPFESYRYMYNSGNTEYCLVGYGVGGIGAKENNDNPIQKTTYVPDDNWYGVSGVIGGEMTFYLTQLPQNTVGTQCSHVKGTVYLCPIIGLGGFTVNPSYNQQYNTSAFIDKPNIEIIELDHNLTYTEKGFMGFTMTLPEVNYTIYGNGYGNIKYASMGYALLPQKVLIT